MVQARPSVSSNPEPPPHDPWAAYLSAKSKQSAGGVSAPPVIARNSEGPSARRFDAQDGRLAQLESQFTMLQQEQQAIKAEVSGASEKFQQQLLEVKSECANFQVSFSQQLQENMNTLQAAQASQQAQFSQGISDLKALLQAQSSPRPPKRAAPEADKPMEWKSDA